jgi:hypothetical protein
MQVVAEKKLQDCLYKYIFSIRICKNKKSVKILIAGGIRLVKYGIFFYNK